MEQQKFIFIQQKQRGKAKFAATGGRLPKRQTSHKEAIK
jgi:hypothetical protein